MTITVIPLQDAENVLCRRCGYYTSLERGICTKCGWMVPKMADGSLAPGRFAIGGRVRIVSDCADKGKCGTVEYVGGDFMDYYGVKIDSDGDTVKDRICGSAGYCEYELRPE